MCWAAQEAELEDFRGGPPEAAGGLDRSSRDGDVDEPLLREPSLGGRLLNDISSNDDDNDDNNNTHITSYY